ncbi:MAG: hypothetical protein ACRDK3_11095 [Actinomycetota bacterium]
MIPMLLVLALALAALAWVSLPLRRGVRTDPGGGSPELEEAVAEKRSALLAILDLEEERATGKLSERDFDHLRADYEARALSALRQADALRDSSDDDDELEIAAVRDRLRCPHCGAARAPDKACEWCGA